MLFWNSTCRPGKTIKTFGKFSRNFWEGRASFEKWGTFEKVSRNLATFEKLLGNELHFEKFLEIIPEPATVWKWCILGSCIIHTCVSHACIGCTWPHDTLLCVLMCAFWVYICISLLSTNSASQLRVVHMVSSLLMSCF